MRYILNLIAASIVLIILSGCDTGVSDMAKQNVSGNMAEGTSQLSVTSSAFEDEGMIPLQYSCDGQNMNPPIAIGRIPAGTQVLALILEDPDAPRGTFTHWIVWDIGKGGIIDENSRPGNEGTNSAGKVGYTGPCPPSGQHRYFFQVYALDSRLNISEGASRQDLEYAMKGHILATGSLMGRFKR